jgi:hypothetical protein
MDHIKRQTHNEVKSSNKAARAAVYCWNYICLPKNFSDTLSFSEVQQWRKLRSHSYPRALYYADNVKPNMDRNLNEH